MKRIVSLIIVFAFLANVSAQLEVSSSEKVGIGTTSPEYKLHVVGDVYATGNMYLGTASGTSNFLSTKSNAPLTFMLNGILSGSTGSSGNANVSFGYEALTENPVLPP